MPGKRTNKGYVGITEEKNNGPAVTDTLPEWFQKCKQRQVFAFDTKRYPFRELVADWLEVPRVDLERIHTLTDRIPVSKEALHPLIRKAWVSAKREPSLYARLRRVKKTGLSSSPKYRRLVDTYRLFLREVVIPLCYPSIQSNVEDRWY